MPTRKVIVEGFELGPNGAAYVANPGASPRYVSNAVYTTDRQGGNFAAKMLIDYQLPPGGTPGDAGVISGGAIKLDFPAVGASEVGYWFKLQDLNNIRVTGSSYVGFFSGAPPFAALQAELDIYSLPTEAVLSAAGSPSAVSFDPIPHLDAWLKFSYRFDNGHPGTAGGDFAVTALITTASGSVIAAVHGTVHLAAGTVLNIVHFDPEIGTFFGSGSQYGSMAYVVDEFYYLAETPEINMGGINRAFTRRHM